MAGGQEREEDALRRRQQARIKEQARRELEKEQQVEAEIAKVKEVYGEKEEEVLEAPTASGGVYFRCPLVGEDVCSREEMKSRIRDFLFSQLECGERGLTAVLIIHTCNSPREKVATCVDTLGKYIDNILSHPEENKYRKIRKSNKAFQDRVGGLEGTVQFLEGCGFQTAQMEGPEGAPEDFWVLPSEVTDMETLRGMLEALRGAEPVVAELDRATKILQPGQKIDNNPLPQDFFSISGEEVVPIIASVGYMFFLSATPFAVEERAGEADRACGERGNLEDKSNEGEGGAEVQEKVSLLLDQVLSSSSRADLDHHHTFVQDPLPRRLATSGHVCSSGTPFGRLRVCVGALGNTSAPRAG